MNIILPKPSHLGQQYGSQFQDVSVVAAYSFRPPYPEETFSILKGLISGHPRVVLDAGCGTGAIARALVSYADRIDAVDPSVGMIEAGKKLPNGDAPSLRWIVEAIETVPLDGPYTLVVAGSSLHWMEWEIAMQRFADLLTPGGYLAIVQEELPQTLWSCELGEIITRYSTNREYRPYDLIDELTRRQLFRQSGTRRTAPISFTQPLESYIESFHARNGFSRERMATDAAAGFDGEVRELVRSFVGGEEVSLGLVTRVTWGWPGRVGG